jgi:hypothetical protein
MAEGETFGRRGGTEVEEEEGDGTDVVGVGLEKPLWRG